VPGLHHDRRPAGNHSCGLWYPVVAGFLFIRDRKDADLHD